MTGIRKSIFCIVLTLIALASAGPADAGPNRFFYEDFSSTAFKDTDYTNAFWDTVAGEITLYPFEIEFVDSVLTPGLAYGVVVRDKYAFVADLAQGLQVYDVSSVFTPTNVGGYVTPSSAWDLAVSGDYAYLACGTAGMVVVDISDPTSPAFTATYNTPGFCNQIRIEGNHAYIADGTPGFQVVDITDPTAPVGAGSVNTAGSCTGLDVEGNYAFIGDGSSGGFRVIDISDPTAPVDVVAELLPGSPRDIIVAGDYAYAAGNNGLYVLDILDPTNPGQAGSFPVSDEIRGIALEGDFLYLACDALGMIALDVSDPQNPAALDTIDTPGLAWRLFVEDEFAFVADGIGGLRIIRVADRLVSPPAPGGVSDVPFKGRGMDIAGDYAYMASLDSGFHVLDISDPANPTVIGVLETPNREGWDVDVEGDYAYVADYHGDLFVINVSDPSAPTFVAELGLAPSSGNAAGIDVEGDIAYIAHRQGGLQIVDVSDPDDPVSLSSIVTGTLTFSVVVDGDVAYVGNVSDGIASIDVSDPTTPVLLDTDNSIYGGRMALNGDYLYIADFHYGLRTVRVSDPANMVVVDSDSVASGIPYGVAVSGRHAVLATTNELVVYYWATPGFATKYGALPQSITSPRGVMIEGDYVFQADYDNGLRTSLLFDRSLDQSDFYMGSILTNVGPDSLVQVRMTTSQVDSIYWALETDSAFSYQPIVPDGEWNWTDDRGFHLAWKAYFYISAPNQRPLCSDLTVEWLFSFAVIDSIVDIGNDQGRRARLSFTRSGFDFPGSDRPIREYTVFRKVDPALGKSGARIAKAEGLPPGAWDFVTTVPADGDDQYAVVVPTLKDSTEAAGPYRTTYLVRARTDTPGVYFDSYVDSGFSSDNLSPGVPFNFKVAYGAPGGNDLSWDRSEADDFRYFRVYRDTTEDFTPDPAKLAGTTADTAWSDPIPQGYLYHYKVSAVDFSGNESDAALPDELTGLAHEGAPPRFALMGNVPNPFNPRTTIRYAVPRGGGRVALRIYDAAGRLVRTLVDGSEEAGERSAVWDGRNDRGDEVASGIYFCRLEAADIAEQRRMLLIR